MDSPLRNAFTCGSPHANTSTDRITQGIQASSTSRRDAAWAAGWSAAPRPSPAAPAATGFPFGAASGSSGNRQTVRGCHTFNIAISDTIEIIAPAISTSQGP